MIGFLKIYYLYRMSDCMILCDKTGRKQM